jgi:hypothetical protein
MSINESALEQAAGAPGASPAPQAPPADPGASPTPGRDGASPAPSPESPNLRQLREQYESVKGQLEPWSRLNAKPDEVAQQISVYSRLQGEAQELGRALGYPAEQVAEAFAKDPARTVAFLYQQAALQQSQPPSPQDLRQEMRRMVEDGMKPILSREDLRLTQEAESRFTREFDRLFTEKFKEGLPAEARDAIEEMVGQLVGDDPEACRRLKFQGQVSDVQRYFDAAVTRFLKIVNAYSTHERQRINGNPSPTPSSPPGKPPSKLDAKVAGGVTVRELMNL